ncbi:MAG: 4Fe-4S dicluster domain-containing protein [Methanohalophilus sp.]|jgi:NAD-dependent dihydropyrimidine dehydrogenase PreA subunit|uniref:Ferredoxin n=1 Tax=Methanohalophilus mahii (strain ATCC 35705 / DSM 5219 / SLP) TaxID=547558 RepID=D5E777_METMS|nr:ferredoxin family protein [Methanohalophilus mahii]ADE37015.1 4Fe-4S ferredoxin iron-sulfur binding domain protein [Methanohalophilus mahii DSM 5219]
MPPVVDKDKCIGSGECAEVCPTEVFDLEEDSNGDTKSVVSRPDDCIECELCVDACPADAIVLE